ncbi:MAG: prepilin-type N-terminal cleavage/methylation domain-containing protein [Clostridiaceae bacterium]|nr:prepilin-type N-terminal cleavage/methylation domain-containing protein [Clostridiaceae bacterium]
MLKFLKSKKGFTLVELLVVVVIIGILVAIAIPVYNDITHSTKKRACEANIRMIKSAIQQYKVANPNANSVTMDNLKGYFEDNKIECPFGVAYTIDENGQVDEDAHKEDAHKHE